MVQDHHINISPKYQNPFFNSNYQNIGCIDAEFCADFAIFLHFSRSTRIYWRKYVKMLKNAKILRSSHQISEIFRKSAKNGHILILWLYSILWYLAGFLHFHFENFENLQPGFCAVETLSLAGPEWVVAAEWLESNSISRLNTLRTSTSDQASEAMWLLAADFQVKILALSLWFCRGPKYQNITKVSKSVFQLKISKYRLYRRREESFVHNSSSL